MPITIDYQPFASTDPGANVESQAQFLIDLGIGGSLQNGFRTGTAQSAQVNKVFRQCSMIAAAVANFIGNTLNINVLDDGNLPNLITNLSNAIQASAWTTGDLKLTMKTVADPGWILCNDGTIGDASSGATYANANAQALFTLLWNNVSNTWAPVIGGRGGSASSDWLAHKKITLTQMLGRALAIAGAGAGLSSRALGQALGEEVHVLSSAEIPATTVSIVDPGHFHTWGGAVNPVSGPSGAPTVVSSTSNTSTDVTGITASVAGGGGAHNNMQPSSFVNAELKL